MNTSGRNSSSGSTPMIPSRNNYSTLEPQTLKTELNNILERQLHDKRQPAMISSSMNPRVRTSQHGNPSHRPNLPPNKPCPPSYGLSDKVSEVNRLLLKEMIERNRNSRRLSNPIPIAKGNATSDTSIYSAGDPSPSTQITENSSNIQAQISESDSQLTHQVAPHVLNSYEESAIPSVTENSVAPDTPVATNLENLNIIETPILPAPESISTHVMNDLRRNSTLSASVSPTAQSPGVELVQNEFVRNSIPNSPISTVVESTNTELVRNDNRRNSTSSDLIRFISDEGNSFEEIPLNTVRADPTPFPVNEDASNILDSFNTEFFTSSTIPGISETILGNPGYKRASTTFATSSHSLDSFLQSTPSLSRTVAETTNNVPTAHSSSNLSSDNYDDSPGELKVGHKIVWFNPFNPRSSPEAGTVKWIGKLKSRYHAGVEFEKAIGNSSGLYAGKRLFTCSLTHGRFVPVSELILHLDFYSGSMSNEPSKYSCGIPTADFENEGLFKSTDSSNCNCELPIVCVICQDPLITPAISAETQDEKNLEEIRNKKKNGKKLMDSKLTISKSTSNKEMVTTKCGHLFHAECLTQWFSLKTKIHQPCPYCQHLMHIQDTIRIYPVQGIM